MGESETARLKQQMQSQLDRLLVQLEDLEANKEEMEEAEYDETKNDTLDQLAEFRASLEKMSNGDLGLVDTISAMQLAIQAAVSEAFRTPEILRMFTAAQPDNLRRKLQEVDR